MNLDGDPQAKPAVPPHVAVWRSVRVHCETKTERSRRTLALPRMALDALRALRDSQQEERLLAGARWQDTGLVFATHLGAALDAAKGPEDVQAGMQASECRRRLDATRATDLFRGLMSHHGVSIEEIASLVGHAPTRITEVVYRRELRPVITTGAEIMDEIFGGN